MAASMASVPSTYPDLNRRKAMHSDAYTQLTPPVKNEERICIGCRKVSHPIHLLHPCSRWDLPRRRTSPQVQEMPGIQKENRREWQPLECHHSLSGQR